MRRGIFGSSNVTGRIQECHITAGHAYGVHRR